MKTKQPKNPFHPGEILLEEFLRPAGTTQTVFARKLGWTPARLNEFIKGKRGTTADTALGPSGQMVVWLNGALSPGLMLSPMSKRRAKSSGRPLPCSIR